MAADPLAVTAKVSPGVYVSLVHSSVKNSTNNLLLFGIVAKVTEADVKTSNKAASSLKEDE